MGLSHTLGLNLHVSFFPWPLPTGRAKCAVIATSYTQLEAVSPLVLFFIIFLFTSSFDEAASKMQASITCAFQMEASVMFVLNKSQVLHGTYQY